MRVRRVLKRFRRIIIDASAAVLTGICLWILMTIIGGW